MNAASGKAELAHVGAGPLENLLHSDGLTLAGVIQEEARNNPQFRFALAAVWMEEGEAFYSKLMDLEKKYRLDEIDPITGERWSKEEPRPG